MYGAFKFVTEALKNDIKPIVGCELFIAEERLKLKFTKDNPDKRFNQVLFAKNKERLFKSCQVKFAWIYGRSLRYLSKS